MTKNILLIGNGAREHAIGEALKRSSQEIKLYSFMSARNPGIAQFSEGIKIGNLTDAASIIQFAQENRINFAVIGPEGPLEAGVVDALAEINIPAVGPKKHLAQLETSKSFTRDLLKNHNIPGNPKFKVFNSAEGIKEFLEELDGEYVVKADGLCGGKGVKLSGEHLKDAEEGVAYCKECIDKFGRVVVEEKFVGQEFSLMSFVDGKNVVDMPPSQDHKRAYEDDKGPNTGGMGSYSDNDHLLPFLKEQDVKDAHDITQKVCDAIRKDFGLYKGVMYGGFIVTKNGVKLIEYNARLGDPEAMNAMPLLKTDFVEVCEAITNGTLNNINLEFENKATVCKYVVPEGYPSNPVKDKKIEVSPSDGVNIYYASVDQKDDGLYMKGSRAIAFVGIADSISEAEQNAENAIKNVTGQVFHRTDIGTKELIQKRINHMKEIRGDSS